MGGYYKIKKILLILIIVLTIIRIFKTSDVFATEAVEVTPTWNDGDYTIQSDNIISTLREEQYYIQYNVITQLTYTYDIGGDTSKSNVRTTCTLIMNNIIGRGSTANSRYVIFSRNPDGTSQSSFGFEIVNSNGIASSNVAFHDAVSSVGYKFINVPFFEYTRANSGDYRNRVNINSLNGSYTSQYGGTASFPCAYLGVYHEKWLDLFQHIGILSNNTDFYNQLLEATEENYTANLYTKQAVQNTYSYLTNDNIEEITSLGISQPQVTEQVDLTDVLDSLEALLTNETYTTKFFTITLPNGRGSTFALSPELLENNLNRVGGQNIVSIIHAVWYIGLYGWYIFSLLGIYGKLLTGDLFHLVKGCSPVTNLVKMSVGTISGGKF